LTRRSLNLIQFWLTVGFFAIPGLAFSIAGLLRFETSYFNPADIDYNAYAILVVVVTLIWALVVQHLKLNHAETLLTLQTGINTAIKATAYCMLSSLSLLFFYRGISFARVFIVVGCLFIFLLSLALIHFFRWIIQAINAAMNGRVPIAILGSDQLAVRVAVHVARNPLARSRVACFVALPGQARTPLDAPVLEWDRLEDVVEVHHCREALLALPPDRFAEAQQILDLVQHLCIPVRMVLDLGEGVFVPERVFDFCGLPLLDVRPYPVDTVRYALGKRLFDFVFSLLVLVLTAPVLLLIVLAIKLTSRGPIFFPQERVSLNGRRFPMLKFRTMFVQDKESCNTRHTAKGDPRITAVGGFLRRTSLDELPQFINVLRGDMSVVGPRPELTFFVQKFRQEIPWYMARHRVKCGITGWAQVNGLRGSDTSIPQRIQYDLYYMRNWSLVFDLKVILLTVFKGLVSRNAY